jgi:hypothetical protein
MSSRRVNKIDKKEEIPAIGDVCPTDMGGRVSGYQQPQPAKAKRRKKIEIGNSENVCV